MKPIWPDLAEVIRDSPALVLAERYFIAQVDTIPRDIAVLMTFEDDVEKTVIVESAYIDRISARQARGPYAAIRLQLAKPFVTPGLLASAAKAVARMRVAQIVYSSYSFDYLMVEEPDLALALTGLQRMGFLVVGSPDHERVR